MATMSVRGECFWILQVSAQRRRPARAKMAALPAELAQGWAEQETVKATASSIAETADSFAFALTTTAGDFATTPRGRGVYAAFIDAATRPNPTYPPGCRRVKYRLPPICS
eukprot:GHVT01070750.1.p1 GENE.GHVT01070750.1~~GHVT01070750.1.p1  ORF type:complete len:111 (-),score=20.89 GHVT01070750.1:117-449(-)